jgi:hypothetical protein
MSHESDEHVEAATSTIVKRTQERFERYRRRTCEHTDRLFARLLLGEWAFAIVVALWFSPYAWQGKVRVVHLHVWVALALGGAIVSLPVALAYFKPGATITRYVIAVAQMLLSALLIHLTGGRIETHFHVFGSLALLAFYLDWGVLLVASAVVVIDHLARGLLWPESVYGITNPEWWRFLEHSFWVVFAVSFMVMSGLRHRREWLAAAEESGLIEALAVGEGRGQSVLERAHADEQAAEKK